MTLRGVFDRILFREDPDRVERTAAAAVVSRATVHLGFADTPVLPAHRADQLERVLTLALHAVRAERSQPTPHLRISR